MRNLGMAGTPLDSMMLSCTSDGSVEIGVGILCLLSRTSQGEGCKQDVTRMERIPLNWGKVCGETGGFGNGTLTNRYPTPVPIWSYHSIGQRVGVEKASQCLSQKRPIAE